MVGRLRLPIETPFCASSLPSAGTSPKTSLPFMPLHVFGYVDNFDICFFLKY
jgi:hypothetical protein